MKKLMRDMIDAVDGAGREFKRGFGGTFRKRGGKHRADADTIRGFDRRTRDYDPKHRADPTKPTSHKKEYDIVEEATRGYANRHTVPRHRDPEYNLAHDLGVSVGRAVRDTPGDVLDEVKGVHKKIPGQVVEELYEDAIGQRGPDKYGAGRGDMRFLAPASEAAQLRTLDHAEIASRFGIDPGVLNGAEVTVKEIPGSRFVSIEIDVPG